MIEMTFSTKINGESGGMQWIIKNIKDSNYLGSIH